MPPLISMCVSMKTAVNPVTHLHEIIVLSALVHTKVTITIATAIIIATHYRQYYSIILLSSLLM